MSTSDSHNTAEPEGPTLQEILIPIWANRKKILLISFVVALVTLGINFLLPVYYKSTATLLPETQKDKLSALGQFADIASLAGVRVPGSEIARLYPTIISSETILRNVVEKKYHTQEFPKPVNLIEYFEFDEETPQKNMFEALKRLRVLIAAGYDSKTSVVNVSVEMPEAQLSADVVNTIVAELDLFMRNKRTTSASEQVKWIDVRLGDVTKDLSKAENALMEFRERNRRVADSPELLLKQERLARDVQVNSTIFVELKKQYELAKLEEIKNITIVNILDPGRASVRKARPARLINTGIAFLSVLVLLSVYHGLKSHYIPRLSRFVSAARHSRTHNV
ncbi:MAG: hypothetical protein KF749_01770 [Bacteroidetes bacterium]|nr:hypothetical protein [Bacteroidota bacterium]MCW5896240.1 hypothetical protein [Bacteroidota bacterium]